MLYFRFAATVPVLMYVIDMITIIIIVGGGGHNYGHYGL